MITAGLCLALTLQGSVLQNGDFEARGKGAEPVPGWLVEVGARNGADRPESELELDRRERHGGRASLHLSGNAATRAWRIVKQEVEVRPGGRYTLSAWTRTRGVEPNGFGLDNAYVGLFLFDAEGQVVARELAWPRRPDSPWTRQELSLVAPPGARRASIYLFLSMLGDLWVDDVQLQIEGGETLAAPEVLWSEDFASARRLDSQWKREVGATSGDGPASLLELDPDVGSPDSPGSLRLGGDARTGRWTHPTRLYPAEPGDIFHLRALVRASDVRAEGSQFENLHLNLLFLDDRARPIGKPRFAPLPRGSYDWTPTEVTAIAPEGARKLQAGVFLSMSGDAWFDRLELIREQGAPPPYSDWIRVEREGLELRYPPDHPRAAELKAYAVALEQSRRATCRALEVDFPDTITVFLYADNDQGRLLTGANLDFADPDKRRVHQRYESYIGHEMVHVIAHNSLGYGQTGILGEGIAVWLNGQPPQRHHARAAELLRAGQLPSVSDLLTRFRELDSGYPAAGSFCGYLLGEHGLETFKAIYPREDPSAALQELRGMRLEDLEPGWRAELAKY